MKIDAKAIFKMIVRRILMNEHMYRSGMRPHLVNEDEGLPAEPAHAQSLALRQLSCHPRKQRRHLGSSLYQMAIKVIWINMVACMHLYSLHYNDSLLQIVFLHWYHWYQ